MNSIGASTWYYRETDSITNINTLSWVLKYYLGSIGFATMTVIPIKIAKTLKG